MREGRYDLAASLIFPCSLCVCIGGEGSDELVVGCEGCTLILSSIHSHFISLTWFSFMCSAFLYINVFSPLIALANNRLNTVPPQRAREETR